MSTEDTTKLESHFRFGENWSSFVGHVDRERIDKAVDSLATLLAAEEVRGKRFLDIGCGSGLSMFAALELGAAEVHGVDLDPQSVAAARTLLSAHRPGSNDWSVEVRSVFDLSPDRDGGYDVVHSWGVLHHTGDMDRAIETAGALVPGGGLFVVALYTRTPFCGAWRRIKRVYARSGAKRQALMRGVYKGLLAARVAAKGRTLGNYAREYKASRGMDLDHDIHDWMGGYPYDSIDPAVFVRQMEACGFRLLRSKLAGRTIGVFGPGCDEFTFSRTG